MRLTLLSILSVILLQGCKVEPENNIPRIEGYGAFKFDMTIEEASAVSPEATLDRECSFKVTDICLLKKISVNRTTAELSVLFDPDNNYTVQKINLTFKHGKNAHKECKSEAAGLLQLLTEQYGSDPIQEEEFC